MLMKGHKKAQKAQKFITVVRPQIRDFFVRQVLLFVPLVPFCGYLKALA
jgi:hypothetical protein